MNSDYKRKQSEILEAYRKDCQRTDDYAEDGMHLSQAQASEALDALVLEVVNTVIGQDDKGTWSVGEWLPDHTNTHQDTRNQLKAEQRQKAKELINPVEEQPNE